MFYTHCQMCSHVISAFDVLFKKAKGTNIVRILIMLSYHAYNQISKTGPGAPVSVHPGLAWLGRLISV